MMTWDSAQKIITNIWLHPHGLHDFILRPGKLWQRIYCIYFQLLLEKSWANCTWVILYEHIWQWFLNFVSPWYVAVFLLSSKLNTSENMCRYFEFFFHLTSLLLLFIKMHTIHSMMIRNLLPWNLKLIFLWLIPFIMSENSKELNTIAKPAFM